MRYKIYLAAFPFSESPGLDKIRPVVALSKPVGEHKLLSVGYITSRVYDSKLESDVILHATKTNGLKVDSTLRIHKIVSVPASILKEELGELTGREAGQVQRALKKLFELS